ncbi:hypothetical protein KIL84_013987 [Mauremys mutica]|uniref:Uncharacterized protein n=1 Tax=Mauremys mutica TaxID=74926 RepID=A0A9D3WYG1_9SAUR|nr:hypothetical protein KIL84_013987 [Mauremys mutica]
MYQLKIQAEPPAQSGSDMRAQELKELLWSGGECNAALIRDGAFRQKQLARQLVEGGACKEQLMAGEQQPQLFQSGFEEKLAFQPEAEGTERRPKAGEALAWNGAGGGDRPMEGSGVTQQRQCSGVLGSTRGTARAQSQPTLRFTPSLGGTRRAVEYGPQTPRFPSNARRT